MTKEENEFVGRDASKLTKKQIEQRIGTLERLYNKESGEERVKIDAALNNAYYRRAEIEATFP